MIRKCCCIAIGCVIGCAIVLGVSLLVVFVHYAKKSPKIMLDYYVTNASLTKFNLTNNTLLDYNLQLNLTLGNPTLWDYSFARLKALPVFAGQNLDDNMTMVSKGPFDVARNANVTLPASFVGNHTVVLGSKEASDFGKGGDFDIGLKISGNYTLSIDNKMVNIEEDVICDLRVSLNSNGTNGGVNFPATPCKVVKIDKQN